MKYEEMSDGCLSLAVSKHIDFKDLIVTLNGSDDQVYLCKKDGLFSIVPVGYFSINNPVDIMAIAIEHGISSVYMVDYWSAHGLNQELGSDEDWTSESESLYRAIAICFLKMMDAKNGH